MAFKGRQKAKERLRLPIVRQGQHAPPSWSSSRRFCCEAFSRLYAPRRSLQLAVTATQRHHDNEWWQRRQRGRLRAITACGLSERAA